MSTDLTKIVPVREHTDFQVKARFIKFNRPTKEEELLSHLPSTGLGTISPPEDGIDDVFPACALFLFGFFCGFPWVLGSFYIRADNIIARSAGVLCCVGAVLALIGSIVFYLMTKQYLWIPPF